MTVLQFLSYSSAEHEQDWQTYGFDPYSLESGDHTCHRQAVIDELDKSKTIKYGAQYL